MLKRRTRADDDAYILRRWWAANAGAVPRDIVALWFGIIELPDARPPGRYLTVAGCDTFDASDPAGAWAKDGAWWPVRRYVRAPQFARLATTDPREILAAGAKLIEALEPHTYVPFPLQGVAVGYEDGDVVVTWSRPT